MKNLAYAGTGLIGYSTLSLGRLIKFKEYSGVSILVLGIQTQTLAVNEN